MGHVSYMDQGLSWLHKRNQGCLEVEEINSHPSQQLTVTARIFQKYQNERTPAREAQAR